MDICSADLLCQLAVDPASLLPIRAKIFGATPEAQIGIIGGIILEILDQLNHNVTPRPPTTACLFYVADNVSSPYLSLTTLKALGTVDLNFSRFGMSLSPKLAVSHSFPPPANCAPSHQSIAKDDKLHPCPCVDLPRSMNVTRRILAFEDNEPPNMHLHASSSMPPETIDTPLLLAPANAMKTDDPKKSDDP